MTAKSNPIKKMARHHSSPFPACFRPPPTAPALDSPHAPLPTTTPNLTTALYQTHLGLFSLTWSRSFLARTLHLHLHPSSSSTPSPSSSSPFFHLTLKPYIFWAKSGSKKLRVETHDPTLEVYWDFTHAKFGPGPEPESGYYIAVISNSATVLLVGDMENGYFDRVGKKTEMPSHHQSMVVRREHVCGTQFYTTRANLGEKTRVILIEVNKTLQDDPRLVIRVDNKRVIQVKHLKWKFRGSERFEVEGHRVQLSWDVYNWLFDEDVSGPDEGYALFTFRFEEGCGSNVGATMKRKSDTDRSMMWSQDSCGLSYERKKMKKKLLVKTSSSSSSSLSTTSSTGSSSVMEWESVEENELKAPTGFSLLVYACLRGRNPS